MSQKGFANILIILVVVVVLGAVGYYVTTKNPGFLTNIRQQNNNPIPQNQEGVILSFMVEPSTQTQGWIMYRDGTKAVLKAKNLKSAEVRYFSTGTGITESSLAGKMNKISESSNGDTWEAILPLSILATSFWAEAEDLAGRKIKSADLGNVGYEEAKQSNTSSWKTYNGASFEVRYPESTSAPVQVTKQLPPDYKVNYSGVKLISSVRLSKLGKQECSYGESGLTSACKAEMEGGIEFIQVNASAQSLTSSLDNSLKTTVTLAGKQIVKWSIGAEGEGTDYYYIPVNSNQTLVVARLYRYDGFPQQTLFNQVLVTLVIK